jgi:hypothetical protein
MSSYQNVKPIPVIRLQHTSYIAISHKAVMGHTAFNVISFTVCPPFSSQMWSHKFSHTAFLVQHPTTNQTMQNSADSTASKMMIAPTTTAAVGSRVIRVP